MNDLNNMERQICIVFVLMLHWCCDKKNSHCLNTEFYKQYVITLDHFIYNTDSVKIETQKELIWYSAFTELFWVMFVCMYVIRCIDIHQYLYMSYLMYSHIYCRIITQNTTFTLSVHVRIAHLKWLTQNYI